MVNLLLKRMMIEAASTPLVPSDYQQVEYIAITSTATGGPYFRTGYRPTNTGELIVECDFMATSYYNTSTACYPIANPSSTSVNTVGVGIYLPPATADRKYIRIWNGVGVGVDTNVSTQVNVRRFVKATFRDTGYEKIEVDGQFVNEGTTAAESLRTRTGMFSLFGVQKGSGSQLTQFYRGRIYRAKIYLDGDLKVDMVPCYRISDDTPGFYERVSQSFKTKTGTGTGAITMGPNV